MRKIAAVMTLGLLLAALAACGAAKTQDQKDLSYFETDKPNPDVLPPPSSIAPDQVKQVLQEKGYTNLGELTFKDGFYHCQAVNTAGRKVMLQIDPLSVAAREQN